MKDKLETPKALASDLAYLQSLLRHSKKLLEELQSVYEECYDAGLSANGNGSLGIARNRFAVSDPTGDALVAKRQFQIRASCRRSLSATERAIDSLVELEESVISLSSVFLEIDAADLRRKRRYARN